MNGKVRSFNAIRAKMFGYVVTPLQWLIMRRSFIYSHSEYEFSSRYRGLSFSATTLDGANCARFKKIEYSHPERWDSNTAHMTDGQEDEAWAEACCMADMPIDWLERQSVPIPVDTCFYGPKAVPYDIPGQVCHITKWNIWKPNWKKTWCSKAVARIILKAIINGLEKIRKRQAEIMPHELDMLTRYYFK